jgi:hypothetical protein
MGGIDAQLLYGTQFLCLERLLFDHLPAWGAMAVHKGLVVATAASGAYLLARRGAGAGRGAAVALAMMIVLAHRYALTVTVHHGIGYALIPWGAYVLVFRSGRRWFWGAAALLGLVHAASSSATHSAMGFALGAVAVWLFAGRPHPLRFWGGLALVGALSLLSWHETLFAMIVEGVDSARALHGAVPGALWSEVVSGSWGRMMELVPLILLALAVLAARRSPLLGRAGGMVLFAVLAGPLLLHLPWARFGLAPLAAVDFSYFTLGLTAVAVVVIGWASRPAVAGDAAPAGPARARLPLLTAAILAMAVGTMGWHKAWHGLQWFGMGGQSVLVAYDDLTRHDWSGPAPVRVVSLPYRLEPNTVAAYGLESFDGLLNIVPELRSRFWAAAFRAPNPNLTVGYNYISSQDGLDFLCCESYPLARIAAPEVLRLANVGFVLSLLPLEGEGLTQVAGPVAGWRPPRRGDALRERLSGYGRMLLGPVGVHVYRLDEPLPRAHVARRVEAAPAEIDPETVQAVARAALDGAALVEPAALPGLRGDESARVESVTETPDGYRVAVAAPAGGVLLVNQLWRPFWRVEIDGVPQPPPVAANLIEMAVALPPGARRVELRYSPPRLRALLGAALHRLWAGHGDDHPAAG